MVAQPHQAPSRHNALLEAAQKIADLEIDLQNMTHAREAHKLRADHAEKLNRQLEAQLTHAAKETVTLVQQLHKPEDRTKADRELVEYINTGWVVDYETVNTLDVLQHFRIVRFIRTAPIEPATDQPPITAGNPVGVAAQDSLTVPVPVQPLYPGDPIAFPPAHSSIAGLWDALYTMDRYLEFVEHWPRLPEYAPRVYAVFATAGCDMADAVIVKSFRPGRNNDQWTLKIIFRNSTQVAPGTQTALVAAGFGRVIAREGREFIFDLPQAWLPSPRKTITASSMTIIDETAPATDNASAQDDHYAQIQDVARNAYNQAIAQNPLPPYRRFPFTNPSSV